MANTRPKNFRLPAPLLDDAADYLDMAKERGVTIRMGEMCSVGLAAFLEIDRPEQIRLLQRATGYHFEKLAEAPAVKNPGGETAGDSVVRTAKNKARRPKPRAAPRGTGRKKTG